jgi:hypothetical protein
MRFGKRQRIEALIGEEALELAKYLRNERKTWLPRLPLGKEPPSNGKFSI